MLEYFGLFLGVLIILGASWLMGKYLPEQYINETSMKEHSWKSVKILARACFCSVCGILMSSNGFYCECCGICADRACMKSANKTYKCKETRSKEVLEHLWVRGNLPLACECYICSEDIDYHSEPGLYGFRCCWCQRTVHDHCYDTVIPAAKCDFGEFREMIIPPTAIRVARIKGTNKIHLTKLIPPDYSMDWKPLIVIVNIKSGSSIGNDVISLFRGILNPLQVFHLGSKGPQQALQWVVKASPIKCRILVAGGDGSVAWILNTINNLKIDPLPEVCILPLGTGNDLSRVLGWGAESPSEMNPIEILQMVKKAKTIQLDRWMVEISGHTTLLNLKQSRNFFMYNYLSVGVDALVTLNFHKARESALYIYSNRVVNKILYLIFGTHQVVQQDCLNLEQKLEVCLDKKAIDLPELQSVVITNIDSWGAGVHLWELSKSPERKTKHCISDGILEVYGVTSSFHIAQLQIGLSKPIFLGHAKEITLKLHNSCPVQIDGEPWLQKGCEIKICKNSEATMLEYKLSSK